MINKILTVVGANIILGLLDIKYEYLNQEMWLNLCGDGSLFLLS